MPIWDSVQRGLEKASQEAMRITKIQRLRSTIDNLSRQMNTQHGNLVNKTMDLYISGQLTQVELLPLCQELLYLKQQLDEAQNELRQVQATQPSGPTPPPPTPTPIEGNYDLPPTVYAPSPNYDTFVAGDEDLTPPPPPGIEPLTISAMSTVIMNAPPPPPAPSEAQSEKRICPACNAEVQPHFTFCQNCGTLIQDLESQHLPTARAGMPELAFPSNEQTVQGGETISAPGEPTPPSKTDSES
jgi:zinc-ribbon domain